MASCSRTVATRAASSPQRPTSSSASPIRIVNMIHTPHVFWAYFLANEERLYDLACADPHAAVDELDQALRKAGVPLGAEIGTKPGEPHDLVFTSNGDTSL